MFDTINKFTVDEKITFQQKVNMRKAISSLCNGEFGARVHFHIENIALFDKNELKEILALLGVLYCSDVIISMSLEGEINGRIKQFIKCTEVLFLNKNLIRNLSLRNEVNEELKVLRIDTIDCTFDYARNTIYKDAKIIEHVSIESTDQLMNFAMH